MAAKASSSAYNSFFFQNQPHQPNSKRATDSNNNVDANVDGGGGSVTDLHLKMSKKIAQLTKVIYSLNSKNDEYENMISFLKNQYEQEKEQLMLETSKKLEEYKHRIVNNSDQSKQIAKLDGIIKEFNVQKEKALEEFEAYKFKTSKVEQELVDKFFRKVTDMNKEVDYLKTTFEDQIQQFKTIISKFDAEKLYLVEDLKSKHRLEIENIKSNFNSSKDTLQADRAKLEEIHRNELNKLQMQIDELKMRNQNDKNDYEQNITKLRALHEKEIEAFKSNTSNEYLSHINSLKEELERLRKEKQENEKELNRLYKEKLEEIAVKEEEIEFLKEKLTNIQSNLESSGKDLMIVNDELIQARLESQKLMRKLTELENDNLGYKERCDKQVEQLLEKSNDISKLEASNMQKTSTISDLKHELENLKNRLNKLCDERKYLENANSAQSEMTLQQIKLLEKSLADIKQENEIVIENAKQSKKLLKEEYEETIEKLSKEYKIREERTLQEYEMRLANERNQHEEKILTLERNLNREFNTESQKVSKDRDRLQSELNKTIEELKNKTEFYETELKKLKKSLSKNEKELIEANSIIEKLTSLKEQLEIELKNIKQEYDVEHKKAVHLEQEFEKLTLIHEASTKDAEIDTKVKLEKLSQELNNKWNDTLKKETENIRKQILAQKEEEYQTAIDKLNYMKDQEIKNLKSAWQTKTNELLDEISYLRRQLTEKELQSNTEIDNLRKEIDSENKRLKHELTKLQEDYEEKVRLLESKRDEDVKKMIDNLNTENEKKISELKARYLEDLQAQMVAQKAALSNMKTAMEKNKNLELEVQAENHSKAIEFMKNDLLQNHYLELDDLKRLHEKEILTCKIELERAIDLNKLRERETQMKVDDFQTELSIRQKRIDTLNNELKELKNLIEDLREDIDIKTKEVQQIKNDAYKEIRNKESQLYREKDEEMNTLNAEHIKQRQLLINEFKQAQEMLKNRIYELEGLLEEIETRYKNRESREEDLEIISSLKTGLKDREETIRKLQDEKKFFQMELVNRETNFNKMFNATPNIGVLNPLAYTNNKKQSKASTVLNNGKVSPNVHSRLDPMPGSPIHDLDLNPNKPLPKKFLK